MTPPDTRAPALSPTLARASQLLRQGKFVLVFDDDKREKEVDLFIAAQHATPEALHTLRTAAGGLVFLAVAPDIGTKLGLPFLQDVFAQAAEQHPVMRNLIPDDIRYDARSSFSVTLNHRKTFTGITDNDRALTIREFALTAQEALDLPDALARELLGARFRAPGHVALCVGANGLLRKRKGHTELGVALAQVAGVIPVLAGAEMLQMGTALPRAEAEKWAQAHGTVLVSGREIEDAWAKLHGEAPPLPASR